jgi:hypothetical protein
MSFFALFFSPFSYVLLLWVASFILLHPRLLVGRVLKTDDVRDLSLILVIVPSNRFSSHTHFVCFNVKKEER